MTTLRAGLSGSDAAAVAAVTVMRGHGLCDVVAVHAVDPVAVRALQQATGAGIATTRFDDLLATGVDFVILAGPAEERLALVRLATEQAVPVLGYAPIAPNLADAEAIFAACDAAQVRHGVAVPEQADPVFEQLRCMFADGWFGAPCTVQAFRGVADRRGDGALHADALAHLAAADVHLIPWLTGRSVLQVTATALHGSVPLRHDHATATAVLRGGGLATLAVSHTTDGRQFALHGTDGSVQLAGGAIVVRGQRPFDGVAFDYDTPGRELVLDRRQLQERLAAAAGPLELHGRFAQWLDDLDGFPCPTEQARQDVRVLDAMQRALASGGIATV